MSDEIQDQKSSGNSRYISYISNPQFWSTVRAIHNHMLSEKLEEWDFRSIVRLGEILEGKYSDHLPPEETQHEIDFVAKLAAFVQSKVPVPATAAATSESPKEGLGRLVAVMRDRGPELTEVEKEFLMALTDFVRTEVASAMSQVRIVMDEK